MLSKLRFYALVTSKIWKIKMYYLPISTAPEISHTVANMQACLMVSTPEPTLVPNELATSLAPMPKAKTNAIRKPTTTIHNNSGENGSMMAML